jgi:hypothetical protein
MYIKSNIMATITNSQANSIDLAGNKEMSHSFGNLPYDDPAIINPAELATFPKQVKKEEHWLHDHHSHLVNRRTPVRDGLNITRTDNQPTKNGFM